MISALHLCSKYSHTLNMLRFLALRKPYPPVCYTTSKKRKGLPNIFVGQPFPLVLFGSDSYSISNVMIEAAGSFSSMPVLVILAPLKGLMPTRLVASKSL